MCGRYATTRSQADLGELFDAEPVAESPAPSWNVAPTEQVPVIRMSGSRQARVADVARWGLRPAWQQGSRPAATMINARAETVDTLRAFKSSFARRRCLVPADGWYEWVREGKRKQAFYMTPRDASVLAFAGIWSAGAGSERPGGAGQDPADKTLSCSIITTAALGDLRRVHDRMPLILPRERWAEWLAGGGESEALLRPLSLEALAGIEVRPVGAAVGNVRNNGPGLTEPEEAPAEGVLF